MDSMYPVKGDTCCTFTMGILVFYVTSADSSIVLRTNSIMTFDK